MIGERKGSKILSCTHAGRVITLVPDAEVFPWHLDPLFIMPQITHGGVSWTWQNQHLHLCSLTHRSGGYMTCWNFWAVKLLPGPRKRDALHGARRPQVRRGCRGLKDGVSSLKSDPLIFVSSTDCCATRTLLTVCFMMICAQTDLLKVLRAAFSTLMHHCQHNCDTSVYRTGEQAGPESRKCLYTWTNRRNW